MISVLSVGFMLSACHDSTNRSAEDNITVTDTSVKGHGVPLDNIHRSRPADTLQDSTVMKDQGVPLDNLDREKRAE